MSQSGYVAAVDLGATSGRVMLGHLGPDELSVEEVHRFPNDPVRTTDGLHWNILELYRNTLVGLRKAVSAQPDLVGIGIDSWAVDYGLVSGDRLINNPFHYRDERTARGVALVHKIADHASLYATNGLQFQPFNSIYQLAVDHEVGVIDDATRMLMIPDLLGFWLTGEQVVERTNASTTGLLDISNGSWNGTLIDKLGLPRSLFPSLVDPGSRVGSFSDDVRAEIGGSRALDVIAVGSHDTASAVVAVPMTEPGAAYVSSGTWSLVGVELDHPVLTEDSREANFTNEGGVDGKIRYLRNVMGMWLLSESIRTWQREGQSVELTTLLDRQPPSVRRCRSSTPTIRACYRPATCPTGLPRCVLKQAHLRPTHRLCSPAASWRASPRRTRPRSLTPSVSAARRSTSCT